MNSANNIGRKKILVLGDVMLDTYYNGDVRRISPEAPVPVFRKECERSVLGGAANVAANLVAVGQETIVMSAIGQDEAGEKMKSLLRKKGIGMKLLVSPRRSTTEKIRFLATNNQQVMRLDVESPEELDTSDYDSLLSELDKCVDSFDILLLSDYLKGFLSFDFTQRILKMAKTKGIKTIVDVKDSRVEKYQDAFLVKPNLKELCELTSISVLDDEKIVEASEYLLKSCRCEYVLTTCGSKGMVLVGDGKPYFIASTGREVFDVTGAGDTAIAYLAACLANGFGIRKSVEIANCAAGIQVGKVGTSEVLWAEVRERLSDRKNGYLHKALGKNSIKTFRKDHQNEKIVFTNGCFDILHVGHVRYLQEAAKLGDVLVIGLNSDASVRRIKGSTRPINNEQDRLELLCTLEFVDYVTIFEEDTPLELISLIKPDVLVKGGDYAPDQVVGREIVERHGGKLILIPFVEGKSTTNIIKRIQK